MNLKETAEFVRIVEGLSKLYPRLPNYAATEAVNFFKERFVVGRDIYNKNFIPRKKSKSKKDNKRAILVRRAVLKRDIHKVLVTADYAIVGTSKITQGYAKANNEGFKGTVTVKAHTRVRYKKVKETYVSKSGNTKNRTSKQVDQKAGKIKVGTHRRKMNIEKREFMGTSPFVDRRIQKITTEQIIKTILSNSSR